MGVFVSAVLALLQQLIPVIGNAGAVAKVIAALVQIIPLIIQQYNDLLPMVKNIINALSDHPASTDEQIASLKALNKQVDDAFEAAAAAALAEDAANQ